MQKSKETTFKNQRAPGVPMRGIAASGCLKKIAFAVVATLSSLPSSVAASELIRFENFPTHSRVIFRLDESIPSELKSTPAGFELFFRGINLADLGAPMGGTEDVSGGAGAPGYRDAIAGVEAWKAQFSRLDEPRIASLKFTETNGGVKVEGKWRYPAGKDALADARMEAFEYRDKAPAQYVVDFWPRKGPTVVQVKREHELAALAAARRKAREAADARRDRRLASDQARIEAYDIGRFCREPLRERSDIFLRLLPVHETLDFSRWIPSTTPDSDYTYFEPKPGEDAAKGAEPAEGDPAKAAQYVRLALQLYRDGKPALAIRTLDFFDAEQPRSEFRQEMKFLRANALLKLGHAQKAEELLRQLMSDNRQSPEALHAAMFLASRMSAQRDHHGAFEAFSWLFTQHPEHRLAWLFHLGAAESLAGLKQTERAAKEYEWVIEKGGDAHARAEAAARIGDLYLERFDYERALAAYSNAQERYPAEMKAFPSVAINRAETLYHLGIAERLDSDMRFDPAEHRFFERAVAAFDGFLKDYPSHPAGWRAAFRRGELDARSLEPVKIASARKFYYDTINHYPFSPGATLARLRLIPCGDHGGFTPETARKFFDGEAAIFTGRGEVPTTHYREFRALAQVQSLLSWGEEDRAVALLTGEIKANPASVVRSALERMYAVLFRKRIVGMIAAGKKYEALAFYDSKVGLLPREARDFDPDYLLKLSQAASDLGFARVAQELSAKYRAQTATSVARGETDGRAPAAAPSAAPADLYERIQDSESAFTEAKALWVAALTAAPAKAKGLSGDGAPGRLARVRELLGRVVEESAFSYERELILGLLDEREHRLPSALAHAVRAQVLRPASAGASLRLDAWIASLQARTGETGSALQLYRSLEERVAGAPVSKKSTRASATDATAVLGVPAVPSVEALLVAQAELLEKSGRWGDAASRYAKAVDSGLGGDSVRFGYANALIKARGAENRAKAKEILEAIARAPEATGAKAAADAGADAAREPASTPSAAPAAAAAKDGASADATAIKEYYRRLARETLAHLDEGKL